MFLYNLKLAFSFQFSTCKIVISKMCSWCVVQCFYQVMEKIILGFSLDDSFSEAAFKSAWNSFGKPYLVLLPLTYLSIYTWVSVYIVDVFIYICAVFQIVSLHSPVHDIQVVNNSFSLLKITVNWEIFHPDPHWNQCVKMAPLGQWKKRGNGHPMSFVNCGRKPLFSRSCSSEWRKKTRSYKVGEVLEYYTLLQYKFTFWFSLWPW